MTGIVNFVNIYKEATCRWQHVFPESSFTLADHDYLFTNLKKVHLHVYSRKQITIKEEELQQEMWS